MRCGSAHSSTPFVPFVWLLMLTVLLPSAIGTPLLSSDLRQVTVTTAPRVTRAVVDDDDVLSATAKTSSTASESSTASDEKEVDAARDSDEVVAKGAASTEEEKVNDEELEAKDADKKKEAEAKEDEEDEEELEEKRRLMSFDQPLLICGIVALATVACGVPLLLCFVCGCCSCLSTADDVHDIAWTSSGDSSTLTRKLSTVSTKSGRQSIDCTAALEFTRNSGVSHFAPGSDSSDSFDDDVGGIPPPPPMPQQLRR